MTAVVLNTDVYAESLRMNSAAFHVFFEGANYLRLPLVIPDSVRVQVCGAFFQRYHKVARDYRRASGRLDDLLGATEFSRSQAPEERNASDDYVRYFDNLLDSVGAVRLEVARSFEQQFPGYHLSAKRPFEDTGERYGDHRIWDAIVEFLKCNAQQLHYVSADVDRYFTDGEMHPDLLVPFERAGIDPSRILPFHSIGEFNSRNVVPEFERLAIPKQVSDREDVHGFPLGAWTHRYLTRLIPPGQLSRAVYGVRGGRLPCRISRYSYQCPRSPRLDAVRRLPSGAILLSAAVWMDVVIESEVNYRQYQRDAKLQEMLPLGGPTCDCTWEEEVELLAKFQIVTGDSKDEVKCFDLDELKGPRCTVRSAYHIVDRESKP